MTNPGAEGQAALARIQADRQRDAMQSSSATTGRGIRSMTMIRASRRIGLSSKNVQREAVRFGITRQVPARRRLSTGSLLL